MSQNITDLETRMKAAEVKARKIRARAARMRRELQSAKTVQASELHRIVGAAVLAWCAADERVRNSTVRYLREKIANPVDRDLMLGTVLDLGINAVGPSSHAEDDEPVEVSGAQ